MRLSAENIQALASQSLRSRIMVSYALCAVAESEIHNGEIQRAEETVKRVRSLLAEALLLVSGTSVSSVSVIREAAEMLAELEDRLSKIEASIRQLKQVR